MFLALNYSFFIKKIACACVYQKLLVILSSNCVFTNYMPIINNGFRDKT